MAEGDVRHVKINDVVEQKLIPPLSKPKTPPTQAQIMAAKAVAEAYRIRKGILKDVEVKKEVVEVEESEPERDDSTDSTSPIVKRKRIEVKKEVVEEPPHYYPPSSPEAPTFYRGKPAELSVRRYPV